MKRETFQMPDPMRPYGSNRVTIESCNVRERHALFDEDSRYRREWLRVSTEHDERVAAIKAHFNAERDAVIARNFAERDAA